MNPRVSSPVGAIGGNQRRYPREVLRRVAVIKAAQRTGIRLATVRNALASLPGKRTPTAEDWRNLSLKWKADLDDRINRCLGSVMNWTAASDAAACHWGFVRCEIPLDQLSRQGSGPRLLDPN